MLGDSISVAYQPFVQQALRAVRVVRATEKCKSSRHIAAGIAKWLRSYHPDVVYFNCGLHDIRRLDDSLCAVSLVEYETNISLIVDTICNANCGGIFALTTPVPEYAERRIRGDEVRYNTAATQIATARGLSISDLYSTSRNQLPNDVHFTEEGYAVLGAQAAADIQRLLNNRLD